MSVTSAYIEFATGKRYLSIELVDSFLMKYRYWTFTKITASALWKKFWTSGIAIITPTLKPYKSLYSIRMLTFCHWWKSSSCLNCQPDHIITDLQHSSHPSSKFKGLSTQRVWHVFIGVTSCCHLYNTARTWLRHKSHSTAELNEEGSRQLSCYSSTSIRSRMLPATGLIVAVVFTAFLLEC